jgi:hypothetical protein
MATLGVEILNIFSPPSGYHAVNKVWLPHLISDLPISLWYEIFSLYIDNIKKQLFN